MGRSQQGRSRSRSPPPSGRQKDNSRFARSEYGSRATSGFGHSRGRGIFQNQYQRRNQEKEDREMRDWMSQEDDFVLKQSKKKARIRIKENRGQLIDKFVLILSILDPAQDPLEDDLNDLELDISNPIDLIEESSLTELQELEKEVEHYLVLEHTEVNRAFWEAAKSISQGRCQKLMAQSLRRGIDLVSSDVDRLLEPKTLEQLRTLESQVHQKLRSDEVIDEEYWEQLLQNIALYKARANLKDFVNTVSEIRLNHYRKQQIDLAHQETSSLENRSNVVDITDVVANFGQVEGNESIPRLKLLPEDQELDIVNQSEFEQRISSARENISKIGYIPQKSHQQRNAVTLKSKSLVGTSGQSEDKSSATNLMYNREAAKGVEEDEEVFAGEAEVAVESKPLWSGKYRPRKPKYFNRVQMGYEWNKYNQTHYDHDNPPPKVVQGYKFNIFYPDLIDTTKAPTYRIERENGRRKGQSFAPAGEEDTCLIRFISGPPYEDIAFRIVDREWDYSAKRERGFKSSFDKGILQLHFQFKKIIYRK